MPRLFDNGLCSFRNGESASRRNPLRNTRRRRSSPRAARRERKLFLESLKSRLVLAASVIDGFGQTPLTFEPNVGQTDESVEFLAHGNGYSLFLTSTEAVLSLQSVKQEFVTAGQVPGDAFSPTSDVPPTSSVLRIQLIGASATPA